MLERFAVSAVCVALAWAALNTGDSSTPCRIQKPMISNGIANRKARRQPQASKLAEGSRNMSRDATIVASTVPEGAPAWGHDAQNPRRFGSPYSLTDRKSTR